MKRETRNSASANTTGIPRTAAEISPAWLNNVLRHAHGLGEKVIHSMRATPLTDGPGLVASVVRLHVEYEQPSCGLPRTFIAKLPASPPGQRLQGIRLHLAEIRFYQNPDLHNLLRVPKVFHASIDESTGDSILLLEDMSTARAGDVICGCALPDADTAVSELARFHAAWWNNPLLERLSWLPAFDADCERTKTIFQQAWPLHLEKLCVELPDLRIPPNYLLLGEMFGHRLSAFHRLFAQPPWTFLHDDFHVDNLLFDPFCVLDWQMAKRGCGPTDLAYFIGISLPTEVRRSFEKHLVDTYHAALVAHGVTGYGLNDCAWDYEWLSLKVLERLVIVTAVLPWNSTRGRQFIQTVTVRTIALMEDRAMLSRLQQLT